MPHCRQLAFCFVMEVRVRICFSLGKTHATNKKKYPFLSGAELKKMVNSAMFNNFVRRSPRRVLDFEQASARSAESAAWDLPRERRIFQFDEASLNSTNSSIPTVTASSVRTERSNGSVDAGSTAGIYEDHPGLNPTSERIVEYQAAIHEQMRRLMNGRNSAEVLAAAERVHGESNNLAFLEEQHQDLLQNGTASEAYRIGVQESPVLPPVEAVPANGDFAGGTGPVIESPLDQFSIHPILDLNIGNFFFSFTNLSLSMLLTLGLVLLLVFVVTKKGGGKSVPNAWQSLVELIYDFVPNLVNEQIGGLSGNVKQKFFPCISVTFTFSLFRNPQGMIPFSFTVTSHFLITLALSFSIFIGITIVGFQRHGLHFFSFLLPAGVPLPLAPFLVLLELISHCFRALSSGIRLFANMMAGHSSVKILSGFAWTMLFLNNIFYFIGDLGPLFIVLALTGLELGVAISQAHVSTISICIYLNDATNLHQNE
uniref:ATP synthase subunit a n=2 Tax=Andropogoneae TaxID=147429 RepID=A0A7T3V3W4_9POAL|nr:ATPase subunit 6 [Chrysopogon zizanioides]QPZ94358.1 ATPase subunit 6 [Chrysopogon zizanioides]